MVRYLVLPRRGLANLNLHVWIEILLSPGGLSWSILDRAVCMLCMHVQPSIYGIINGKYLSFGHFSCEW